MVFYFFDAVLVLLKLRKWAPVSERVFERMRPLGRAHHEHTLAHAAILEMTGPMPGNHPKDSHKAATKQCSRFPNLLAGAKPRGAPILARAAHSFHPLPQEPGYSGKTSPLTPAGPLPERVAARSGANTCGTRTTTAACSTEHGRSTRRHKHEG
jgi:hypothetical protein